MVHPAAPPKPALGGAIPTLPLREPPNASSSSHVCNKCPPSPCIYRVGPINMSAILPVITNARFVGIVTLSLMVVTAVMNQLQSTTGREAR
jgi:hypothetical protein